jgi:hypothetical protein
MIENELENKIDCEQDFQLAEELGTYLRSLNLSASCEVALFLSPSKLMTETIYAINQNHFRYIASDPNRVSTDELRRLMKLHSIKIVLTTASLRHLVPLIGESTCLSVDIFIQNCKKKKSFNEQNEQKQQ